MSDLGNIDLDKPPDDLESGRRRASGYGAGILLLLLAGGAGYYFYTRDRAPASEREPATSVEAPAAGPATGTDTGSLPAEPPLPALAASDALARELLAGVSSRPELASWLLSRDLVRAITAVVDRVARGEVPAKPLAFLAPAGRFAATGRTDDLRLDAAGYARYDAFGDLIASIDAEGTARAYARLRPLFEEAYRDLGHPDGDFDAAIAAAIGQVVGAPVIDGEIRLATRGALYRYADDRLEGASAVQRQLLRTGPRNTRLVQAKARELSEALAAEGATSPRR